MRPVAPVAPSTHMKRTLLAAALLALATGTLYGSALANAPVYLGHDEVHFALQSQSVATTGRDISGNRLPLYFPEPGFSIGRDPVYIYATALVLQFVPLSESALRLPSVIAAAITVGLVVIAASEFFGSVTLGVMAGGLLALTPTMFIHGRQALSVIHPLPFVISWMTLLLIYLRTQRLAALLAAIAFLAAGLYTYLGMSVFVPLYAGLTAAILIGQRRWAHLGLAGVTLAVMLLPTAAWYVTHPSRLGEIVESYRIYDPSLNPRQGTRDLMSWFSLGNRFNVYWQAFNPSRLFISGESSLNESTRTAGTFPLAFLLLLPIGMFTLIRRPFSGPHLLVVVGLLTAPLPAVLVLDVEVRRYLVIAIFAAVIATAGVARLWSSGGIAARGVAILAVASVPWLFSSFYQDYQGDWRVNSSVYFGGNIRGAVDAVLASPRIDAPSQVLLSNQVPYLDAYWELYRRMRHRDDLEGRARWLAFADGEWAIAPPGTVAVLAANEPAVPSLTAAGWQTMATVTEFFGGPAAFVVLSNTPPR